MIGNPPSVDSKEIPDIEVTEEVRDDITEILALENNSFHTYVEAY